LCNSGSRDPLYLAYFECYNASVDDRNFKKTYACRLLRTALNGLTKMECRYVN
jgi:hypothetical protein